MANNHIDHDSYLKVMNIDLTILYTMVDLRAVGIGECKVQKEIS